MTGARRWRRGGGAAVAVLAALALVAWWAFATPAFPLPAGRGQLVRRTLDHDGLRRSYLLYVPPATGRPAPVVLVLHGSASSGERMRRATAGAFEPHADEDGTLVVYPDGHAGQWRDCRTAGPNPARDAGVDDVRFLQALVADLPRVPALAGRPVDQGRVFAFGLSNGGQMALRLALEAPDLVAGVASVAAALPVAGNSECAPGARAVPVLMVNGDADPISPYGGGTVTLLGPFGYRGDVQSAPASAGWFAARAGYATPPFEHRYPDEDPDDGTVALRQVWSGTGRPEVALITIYGGGHTIPHPQKRFPRVLGRTGHDLSAADEAWRFFGRQAAGTAAALAPSPPR